MSGSAGAHRNVEPHRFRVVVTSEVFEPGFRGGGPIRSLAAIVDTISDGTDLWLITRDRDLRTPKPYPGLSGKWVPRGRARVLYLNTRRPDQWLRLWRDLRSYQPDLLYLNSLWEPTFTIIPVVAAKLGLIPVKRVLLAPRGELSEGALSLKSFKKRGFMMLWRPLLATMDVTWHASSESEATDIRAAFPRANIEINRVQVSLPPDPLAAALAPARPARLVFIGRISPMKNLDLVLKSLKHVRMPVDFDVYGPLEDADYWSRCQVSIRDCPPYVRARYMGELGPSEVRRTFSLYDAFVFLTRGENFGHIIAESLSASCPVVCSDRTPWSSVLRAGGGTVLHDLTPQAIAMELERIATMTPLERLHAREGAAIAYRAWRADHNDNNILEQLRLADAR
jgi:glycosyltransferase involved in cell wall biosynthesis